MNTKNEKQHCTVCEKELKKTAYLEYDTWDLSWECIDGCQDPVMINWPYGDRWITVQEMEEEGYIIT